MTSKHYGQIGIGSIVEFGKAGPKLKNNSGVFEHRNNADSDFVVARGAHPVGDNDFVTKYYLETRADVIVTGQINGGSPPAAGTPGRIYICTTAGGVYTLKYLYRDNGSSWDEIVPIEGMRISVTDALTGGTDEYDADHLYMWDADGSVWVDLGPAPAATEVIKVAALAFDYTDTGVTLIKNVPSGSTLTKCKLNVTQVFDGTTPVAKIGDASDDDRHMTEDQNNLLEAELFVTENMYLYGAATDVNLTVTIGGTPTQGQARALIEYALA